MYGLTGIGMLSDITYNFQPHTHSVWEIIYYTEGTGINCVGDTQISFKPGTIVFQPPDLPHFERAEGGYKNIHFTVEHMDEKYRSALVLEDNLTSDFKSILLMAHTHSHVKPNNWESIVAALMNVLTEYMRSWTEHSRGNPYVEMCEKEITDNISNSAFSTSELLERVPLSKTHLEKLFKEHTGYSLHQYLTEKRISYAKQLMKSSSSGLLVKNIACMCGINDQYYFSRLFKKHTGSSPDRWMEKDRQNI